MPYDLMATAKSPAFIIYVLDVSASMSQRLDQRRRLDVVMQALGAAIKQMVYRSTKGMRVSSRYRLAMYAYSDHVYDLLDGVKTIDQLAARGVPELPLMRSTDSARAFSQVEKLLLQELPSMQQCPAPLVCHMTDGEYTGDDPEPIVRRIMNMSVPDGKVLVENIFISDSLLTESINDAQRWPGILPSTRFTNRYAEKLRAMSSTIPESYRIMMLESGYNVAKDAVMMLPGLNPELVEMGFVMSMSTKASDPIGR
jgi:hypothetical protein